MANFKNGAVSRRGLFLAASAIAFVASIPSRVFAQRQQVASYTAPRQPGTGMPNDGPGTPKLAHSFFSTPVTAQNIQRMRQLGISSCILNTVLPLDTAKLAADVKALKAGGLFVGNLTVLNPSMDPIVRNQPNREKVIEDFKTVIRTAGALGIPVVQYSLYVQRLNEGYFHAPDPSRGNAVLESFDYDGAVTKNSVATLPPLPGDRAFSSEELWANATYFIKSVVPVAEAANVRLAQHPNDAPGPITRGSPQIMCTVEDWKRFIAIVDSPANGICWDCGITREVGGDPVEVCKYFGSRDRINAVHYRNVIMQVPRKLYTETPPDMGDIDMLAVMKELVSQKYKFQVWCEHARGLTVDEETKSGNYAAWAFHVGYARAMLQTALMQR